MATHIFMTDREYLQSSLDVVSRLIFEKACDVAQCSALPKLQLDALKCLSSVALKNDLSNAVINTYFDLITDNLEYSPIYTGEEND